MISCNWELNNCMSIILQIWYNFYVISSFTKKKQNTRRLYQDLQLSEVYSDPWYIQNSGTSEPLVKHLRLSILRNS